MCVCVVSSSRKAEMEGVSLIKAIIGTSLPAKPTNHLPAARPSPWERVLRGKLNLGGCQLVQKCQSGSNSQRFTPRILRPVGVAGMAVQWGRALFPGRPVRRVTKRNIFRGNPDWSPVFNYMSLSQELDQGS